MILQSLARAFASLLHPRMLLLMVWPALVALALWLALAIAFWAQAAAAIQSALGRSELYEWIMGVWPMMMIAAHVGWIVLALLFVPVVLITAVAIIGVFAMPMMVNHVAERDYPQVAQKRGGSFAGSVWNTAAALLWLFALAILTLPLWIFPPLWPVLPLLLFAHFNQRVFRYDALAEHASAGEMREILARDRWPLLGMGIAVSIAGYVPVLGLFSPVYGGLAFIHYALARLASLRSEPIEGAARREA